MDKIVDYEGLYSSGMDIEFYAVPQSLKSTVTGSKFYLLLVDLKKEIVLYAEKNDVSLDQFEKLLLDVFKATSLFRASVTFPNMDYFEDDFKATSEYFSEQYKLRQFDNEIHLSIKLGEYDYFDRQRLENTVEKYLSLPVRSKLFDKHLVEALVAMEYSRAFDGNLSDNGYQNPLKDAGLGFLFGVVTCLLGGAYSTELLSLQWPTFILVGLFLTAFSISLVFTTINYFKYSKARKRLDNVLGVMKEVYGRLNSSGPISLKHVFNGIRKSAELEIVWPAPLFVLLEDMERRTDVL